MPFGSFFFAAVSSEMLIKFYEYEKLKKPRKGMLMTEAIG